MTGPSVQFYPLARQALDWAPNRTSLSIIDFPAMVQNSPSGTIMKKIPFDAVAMPGSNTDMDLTCVLDKQYVDASTLPLPRQAGLPKSPFVAVTERSPGTSAAPVRQE